MPPLTAGPAGAGLYYHPLSSVLIGIDITAGIGLEGVAKHVYGAQTLLLNGRVLDFTRLLRTRDPKEPDMEIKEHEYIKQTLERYTNCRIEEICDHILITNFKKYIMRFKEKTKGKYAEGNFRIVNAKDINCSMIDFGIGSPQAALVLNCLAYLENLKTVIMLGMCGGIDDVLEEGDFIVPSAAIRGEGTSNHYLPPEFPAIPASSVNLYCIGAVRQIGLTPRCGIIYTTNRRLWEFDNKFIDYLRNQRILAIDMELATLFSVAYNYGVPIGSIMLVSDMPLQRRGIKDKKKQDQIFAKYLEPHLELAFDAVKNMESKWGDVKRRLISEW